MAFVLVFFSLPALSSRAEELTYQAEISAADRTNSRGEALATLREFLRQDRFNVHSKQLLDPGDTLETRFASVEGRALIDGARLTVAEGLEASVIEGEVTRLEVAVSGSGKNLELRVAAAKKKEPPVPAEPLAKPAGTRNAYRTTLGEGDMLDSNGVKLTKLRDILLRDRSNVNLLGHRDPGDEKYRFYPNSRQRRIFESAVLLVDPALVNPLLGREPVAVEVYLTKEDKLLVIGSGAGVESAVTSLEEMVDEKNEAVTGMTAARVEGVEAAARKLVELGGLAYGLQHEKTLIMRVNHARLLAQEERQAEIVPLLPGLEADFRAAARRGVDETSVFPVMSFLVESNLAAGKVAAADHLLSELLEEPGGGKWKLSKAQRSALSELRKSLSPPAEVP